MKILVTGGTGFIGSHTVVELLKAGHTVDIIDNLSNSKITVLDAIEDITHIRPNFFQVDLRDYSAIEQIFQSAASNNTPMRGTAAYDAVFHFAGLKSVAESVKQPILYYNNNLISTLHLLRCMKEYNTKQLVFSSSATVYGTANDIPFTEDSPVGQNIISPYGKSKYMIEEILEDVVASDNSYSVVILRYFNPIGAHPSGKLGEDPNDSPNNLMPVIMKVASGEYPELSVYGNDYPTSDGTCVRDYIHVVDLAKGPLAALDHMKPGVSIYNLGSGKGTSVLEIISAFEKASGEKLPYKIAARRPGDYPEFYADPTKAEKELGWKTELTIDDAMRDTLNFLRSS